MKEMKQHDWKNRRDTTAGGGEAGGKTWRRHWTGVGHGKMAELGPKRLRKLIFLSRIIG